MIARLLCRIGRHRDRLARIGWGPDMITVMMCDRCERSVRIDRL